MEFQILGSLTFRGLASAVEPLNNISAVHYEANRFRS